jgi:hypothetical protein
MGGSQRRRGTISQQVGDIAAVTARSRAHHRRPTGGAAALPRLGVSSWPVEAQRPQRQGIGSIERVLCHHTCCGIDEVQRSRADGTLAAGSCRPKTAKAMNADHV